ncbi:coiled-coil domain-containing protein 201 [Loxodonta africana]|uniref:coiled-coil domain-containing protein 201 n=1 Tax=Elephas maximus indicus TaxID=99487 RepID=UPI002116009C|nr:coiled-coil domain-containing protein 201 [Elephas maximus indicus]
MKLALCVFALQIPGWNLSEGENASLATGSPLRKLIKHSTPEDSKLSHSMRPLGEISSLSNGGRAEASPMPTHSFQDLSSHLTGLSFKASFRQRRLSTVSASKEYSGQLGPDGGLLAPEEEPPTSTTSSTKQKSVSPRAQSRPVGWPGISNTNRARRNKRDLKKKAAVMERVRQWEARLLQNIEEAVHYELTIEPE